MLDVNPSRILQLEVPSTQTLVKTLTVTKTIVKETIICNTANAAVTFNMWVVPTGETLGTQHKVYSSLSVARNESVILQTSTVLHAGDQIYLEAGNTGLSLYLSGAEFNEVV